MFYPRPEEGPDVFWVPQVEKMRNKISLKIHACNETCTGGVKEKIVDGDVLHF